MRWPLRSTYFALLLSVLSGGAALADGAFPDSLGILVPSGEPGTIYAATNFGLVITRNGGQDWDWVCEQATGANAWQYTAGAAPSHVLYAVSLDGIRRSDDGACSWHDSQSPFLPGSEFDVFPAPSEPARALALGMLFEADAGTFGAVESLNAGVSFDRLIHATAPGEAPPTGIEIARSDPASLWMTMAAGEDGGTSLQSSSNGGETWTPHDVGTLATDRLLLVAIDRTRPERVFLRAIDPANQEWLGEYDSTTGIARRLTAVPERMTAFVQRENGELLMGSASGGLLVSRDDGESFAPEPGPSFRALAERDGTLYAVTDNLLDGYAVARSSDGRTWEPLLEYKNIRGPLQCGEVAGLCELPWVLIKDTLGVVDPPQEAPEPPPTGCGCLGAPGGFTAGGLALLLLFQRNRRRMTRSPE